MHFKTHMHTPGIRELQKSSRWFVGPLSFYFNHWKLLEAEVSLSPLFYPPLVSTVCTGLSHFLSPAIVFRHTAQSLTHIKERDNRGGFPAEVRAKQQACEEC